MQAGLIGAWASSGAHAREGRSCQIEANKTAQAVFRNG